MHRDGIENGKLIDLLSVFSSEDQCKHKPWCLSFSQCEDEDAPSGDMEMEGKLCETACLHDIDISLKEL